MKKDEEIVRVMRVVVYTGPRKWVEETISKSIQGTRKISENQKIEAATIGNYPDILIPDEH